MYIPFPLVRQLYGGEEYPEIAESLRTLATIHCMVGAYKCAVNMNERLLSSVRKMADFEDSSYVSVRCLLLL